MSTFDEKPILQGVLYKRAAAGSKDWKKRHVALYATRLTYSSKPGGKPIGEMVFTEEFFVQDGPSPKGKHGFLVTDFDTVYNLACDSADAKAFWMLATATIIRKQLQKVDFFQELVKNVKRDLADDPELKEKEYKERLENYYKTTNRPLDKRSSTVRDHKAAEMLHLYAVAGPVKTLTPQEIQDLEARAKDVTKDPDEAEWSTLTYFEDDEKDEDQVNELPTLQLLTRKATQLTLTSGSGSTKDLLNEVKPRDLAPTMPPRKSSLKAEDLIPAYPPPSTVSPPPQLAEAAAAVAAPQDARKPSVVVQADRKPSVVVQDARKPSVVAAQEVRKPSVVVVQDEQKPATVVQEERKSSVVQAARKPSVVQDAAPAAPPPSTAASAPTSSSAPPVKGSLVASKLGMWQKKVEDHELKQANNVFSGSYAGGAHPTVDPSNYGKPPPGSKTEERAAAASKWVEAAVEQLVQVLNEMGTYDPEEGGVKTVCFGPLFYKYQEISDTLVGILMRAKKRKRVKYPGDMLFQGQHDRVKITLLEYNPE